MTDRPALSELRARVFKHSGSNRPEVGTWLARRVGRPSAIYGTWVAARVGISAHAVTTLALVANLGGAGLIATGARWGFVAGVASLALGYWFDHVDGQVARWRGTASLSGVYFDYMMHHASAMALGFALGFGLTMRVGSPLWSLVGFMIAAGWAGLSLHNDCRYKAFFQRLKSGPAHIVTPPPLAPATGRAGRSVSWLAAKVCEPHIVLLGLAGLAVVAMIRPMEWLVAWRFAVVAMAILAPALAVLRVGRAIRSGSVDSEFALWFPPQVERPTSSTRPG